METCISFALSCSVILQDNGRFNIAQAISYKSGYAKWMKYVCKGFYLVQCDIWVGFSSIHTIRCETDLSSSSGFNSGCGNFVAVKVGLHTGDSEQRGVALQC